MSALLTMFGADTGAIRSSAERDELTPDDAIWLRLEDSEANRVHVLMDRAEAAKIMADLATAMGLIEAPKVAA